MKIGVLTVPFNNNYGGLLQAFALKSVLGNLGNEVVFINRQRNPNRSFKFKLYRLLVKLHIIEDYLKKRSAKLSVNTDKFKHDYLEPITKPYYSNRQILEINDMTFDFFIVGSDQVWRYKYALDSIDEYFFSFITNNNIPRISYAASFGIDVMDYPDSKRLQIIKLLKLFKGISVREESGKRILKEFLEVEDNKIDVVLDPTFLLPCDEYLKLFSKDFSDKHHYLFSYILDDNEKIESAINKHINENRLQRFDIKAQTASSEKKVKVIAPVEKWLEGIYYSDIVFTDSFHGVVFSLIFNKPFVVFSNSQRGATRIEAILKKFGLEERLVDIQTVDLYGILNKSINWEYVNNIINEERSRSLEFLKKNLSTLL